MVELDKEFLKYFQYFQYGPQSRKKRFLSLGLVVVGLLVIVAGIRLLYPLLRPPVPPPPEPSPGPELQIVIGEILDSQEINNNLKEIIVRWYAGPTAKEVMKAFEVPRQAAGQDGSLSENLQALAFEEIKAGQAVFIQYHYNGQSFTNEVKKIMKYEFSPEFRSQLAPAVSP